MVSAPVMTTLVCTEKSLYYRPFTDQFPLKYPLNTDHFCSKFPKIQIKTDHRNAGTKKMKQRANTLEHLEIGKISAMKCFYFLEFVAKNLVP